MHVTAANLEIMSFPLKVARVLRMWEGEIVFKGLWRGIPGRYTVEYVFNPRARPALQLGAVDVLVDWSYIKSFPYEEWKKLSVMILETMSYEMKDFLNGKGFRSPQQLENYLKSLKGS